MTEENNQMSIDQVGPANLPPIKIAFVIDNEVVDILHTDERLAAIFLSNPKIVDVTNMMVSDPASIQVGFAYNEESNSFSAPDNNQ